MEKILKILGITTRWLFILCLPVLLLTAGIGWAVNSQWLYKSGFQKYGVSQTTGLANAELVKVANGLISYFNSGDEFIDLTVIKDDQPFTLFSEQEIAHLRDVKRLIWLDYRVLLGTGMYALGYILGSFFLRREGHWRWLAPAVVGGGSFTLGLMLVLGLIAILDFDQFFLQFHLISFANDLWLLDPATDYLIMLFPQGFWYYAVLFCTIITTGLASLLMAVAGGYLLVTRRGVNLAKAAGG